MACCVRCQCWRLQQHELRTRNDTAESSQGSLQHAEGLTEELENFQWKASVGCHQPACSKAGLPRNPTPIKISTVDPISTVQKQMPSPSVLWSASATFASEWGSWRPAVWRCRRALGFQTQVSLKIMFQSGLAKVKNPACSLSAWLRLHCRLGNYQDCRKSCSSHGFSG